MHLPKSPKVDKPLRVTKSYHVQPHLNEAMREYAARNKYTLASCVDAAFGEFLEKHASQKR